MMDILSTVGGYHDKFGDILMHVGDIVSTVEVFSTVRGKSFVITPPRYS